MLGMPQVLNGVVVETLRATAGKATAEPKESLTRCSVTWAGGLKSVAQSRDQPPVTIDEPAVLGGGNSAATPLELLLASLGSCVLSMIAAQAAHKEVNVSSMRAEVEGRITEPSI